MNEIVRREKIKSFLRCGMTDEHFKEAGIHISAFPKFTMDLCRTLRDMEKEHSANCQSAPMDIHIVAVLA